MRKLRYAVIGTGGIASVHIAGFTSRPEVDLVGLSDPSESNLRKTAASHPKAFIHTNAVTMLREAMPDLVSICTPNLFHCKLTLAALRHGAHVACEKPMAMTLSEAEKMEKARVKAGRFGIINFAYRNQANFRFARELIARGDLGRLLRINIVYLQSFLGAPATAYSWRNDKALAGYGALGDLGVHMIDTARFITGHEMTRVTGTAQTLIARKPDPSGRMRRVTTDTNASFLIEFDNGMVGTFETSQAAPGYGNHFRIDVSGETGTLQVLSENEEIRLFAGKTLTHHATWSTSLPGIPVPADFKAIQPPKSPEILVDLVLGRKPAHYPSFRDGVKAQKILDGIFRSMKSKAWVSV